MSNTLTKPLEDVVHGTAGIALSLLKLAAASGQERYREIALAYDRSLFLPEQQIGLTCVHFLHRLRVPRTRITRQFNHKSIAHR